MVGVSTHFVYGTSFPKYKIIIIVPCNIPSSTWNESLMNSFVIGLPRIGKSTKSSEGSSSLTSKSTLSVAETRK